MILLSLWYLFRITDNSQYHIALPLPSFPSKPHPVIAKVHDYWINQCMVYYIIYTCINKYLSLLLSFRCALVFITWMHTSVSWFAIYIYTYIFIRLQGISDALRVDNVALFFLTSKTIRKRTGQCFLLNMLIFLGSMFLLEYLVVHHLRKHTKCTPTPLY